MDLNSGFDLTPHFLFAARFQQINQLSASRNHNICTKNSGVFKKARRTNPAKSSQIQQVLLRHFCLAAMVRSQASEFLLAGASACGAITLTNPVDVVKTRLQLQGELRASGAAYTGRGCWAEAFQVLKGLRDPKIGCSE